MTNLNAILRTDFGAFLDKCFRHLNPGEVLSDDDYLTYLCYIATRIATGENRRQIVNLPPAHLKTLLFSIAMVAWILARDGTKRIMVVTNAQPLAQQITYAIREIMRSKWFKEMSDTRLSGDYFSAGDFMTKRGGRVFATSADGKFTGHRADIIIVDDLLDMDEARNEARVREVNDKFDTKIATRLNDPRTGTIVVVAHRLHEEDLTAHLMAYGGWNRVALEMVAERDKSYQTENGTFVRKKGDLLREGLFTKKQIEHMRERASIPEFRLLFQQGKGARSSFKISPKDFPLFHADSVLALPVVISIDTAQKGSGGSSRHAIQVWKTDGQDHYLVEAISLSCRYDELRRLLARLARKFKPSIILIEDASSGSMLIEELEAKGTENVHAVVPRGAEADRLATHLKTIKKGRVHLLYGAAWLGDWVSELVIFPTGADDQVDALTQFLAFMAMRPTLKRPVSHERGTMAVAYGSMVASPLEVQGSVLVRGSSFGCPPPPHSSSPPLLLPARQDPIPVIFGTPEGPETKWI
jgi:predicted phage terminase large subunit-like protein